MEKKKTWTRGKEEETSEDSPSPSPSPSPGKNKDCHAANVVIIFGLCELKKKIKKSKN